MTKTSTPVTVGIFGSCMTRDVFNRKFNPDYKKYFNIVSFQNQTSVLSLMSTAVSFKEEDLSPLEGWDKKSIEDELNRSFLQSLKEEKPKILIIDFFADARFKSIAHGESYITVNEWKTTKSTLYKKIIENNEPFIPSEEQLKEHMKAFTDFIKRYLPRTKIILNKARGIRSYTDRENKEILFNQKFITRLNQRWEMLDSLFIDIANPIQLDVMDPDVKGYINHLWSIGYVHYTPNYYHNFLRTLVSIQFENRLSLLQSSLSALVPIGTYPEEKFSLIKSIRSLYLSLNTAEKDFINSWLHSRYKEFLSQLVLYNKDAHHYVKFVNYSFKLGQKGAFSRDITFAHYLLELVITRKIFSNEEMSAYTYLHYGSTMYHNFITSDHYTDKVHFFNRSRDALSQAHTSGKTDYLKNRSAYFLSLLYAGNKDFESAIKWYKLAIKTKKPAPNISTLPFLIILRSVGINGLEIFKDINKFFTSSNTHIKDFWLYLQSNIENHTFKNHVNSLLHKCNFQENKSQKWVAPEGIDKFISTLNLYLQYTVDYSTYIAPDSLQDLYRNTILTDQGKASILLLMADTYAHHFNDFERAILMASESNTLYYNHETSYFISSLILKSFSNEIRNILSTHPYTFISPSVNKYISEQTRGLNAWKRFISRGFVSGNFQEEVDFLEFLMHHSTNREMERVLKTRLAYLYFTGTAGISEDHYETPDIEKSRTYFQNLKSNPLVKKYLNHPRLSIYQDMERYLDNKQEKYLFFENKNSDELLIIFSCAGSYNRYTQLKVFFERNKINVLFLNNPQYNWYHGTEWSRIKKTIEEVALKNFKKENIITYFGSMGGYAALRTGLTYGFRTIVFNPQVDLNIWIKHRPAISVRLLKEDKLQHLQMVKTTAFEQMPLYYATSSAVEDVEAFSLILQKISLCKNGLFVFEKIPDNIHEGIFGEIYAKKQQEALLNIATILKDYYPKNKYKTLKYKVEKENKKIFWSYINESMNIRIMIQIRDGEIFYAKIRENFLSPLICDDIQMKN